MSKRYRPVTQPVSPQTQGRGQAGSSRRRMDIDFTRRPVNTSVKCSDPDCIPMNASGPNELTVKIIKTKHIQTQEYTNSHAFLFNEPKMTSTESMEKIEKLHQVMEGEAVTK